MKTQLGLALLCLFVSFPLFAGDQPLNYPKTKRIDHTDEYHGTTVADPYRWLETDVRENKEVADWAKEQNQVTNAYLKTIPEREAIKKRLTDLWNYERFSVPFKKAGHYFYTRNDGLQNQSVLFVQETLKDKPRELIDPNKWSADGTVSLSHLSVSPDARHLVYGKSDAGSDWGTWYVMDITNGQTLTDELKWIKFSGSSWMKDGTGFFYSRYPQPKEGEKFQGLVYDAKIYYHKIGTPQVEDKLIYERPDHKEWGFMTSVSDDDRYLVITTWQGTDDRYRVTYLDLQDLKAKPVDLIDNFEQKYDFAGNDGPVFYFTTDHKAPRGRVIAIDIGKPRPENWKEIIPENKNALQGVSLFGNQVIAEYLKDAQSQVVVHGLDGKLIRTVDLPGIGSAGGFNGDRKDTETFYSFSSFAVPSRIYRYDIASGKSELYKEPKVLFDPDHYVTKQVFYTSKDGTKVPMFISHKKGLKLDGNTPTLLYAYGGFNISITPTFSISKLSWMELGGVYAVANIRGGGEYGKDWHQAAIKLNRPKAYEDFIAAAEWLIDNKITCTEKLAIMGGSNGGLLVGAVMCKRPDLFGAALPHVGVMDMLRFHKFTAGRYWVDDYGSADNPDEFKVLYSYSPYHNLKQGVKYPPTLVITADTDDRVVPSHSFKFISQLQHCQGGTSPVLARIETRAGHGAGRPTSQIIEEVADEWGFLVKNLGMKVDLK
jgi:prolyl oligopeptidase